ncbi:MAG: lysozyme inhibitor LprI family protein [Pseudomonadota bacterium]
MLFRSLFLFAFAVAASGPVGAQSPITIEEFEGIELLTYEEIARQDPPYPFEAEVEACLEQDRLARGIGAHCIGLLGKYCPQEVPSRGVMGALACSTYMTQFWNKRLQTAYAETLDRYQALDRAHPDADPRAPLFESLQARWQAWRAAKCEFAFRADARRSHWRAMDKAACYYKLTAIRALELEQVNAAGME